MKETTKVLTGLAVAVIIGAGMSGMIAGNKGTCHQSYESNRNGSP